MQVVITFGTLALVLFIMAFIGGRRFGLMGFALAAGSVLSGIWGSKASSIVGESGVVPNSLVSAAALSAVIILPAVLVLFSGKKCKTLFGRIISSALFTILALAFLIEPVGHVLFLQGIGVDIYGYVSANRTMIIGICLLIAVADLATTRHKVPAEKHREH